MNKLENEEFPAEDSDSLSRFDFVAVDFETATGSNNSACAIGIIAFRDCKPVETFSSYIKPPDNAYKDSNIALHGITPDMTEQSPTLTELWPEISRFFDEHTPVVAHNAQFDMSVLRLSTDVPIPDFVYVDSITLSQSFGIEVRGLHEVAEAIGIDTSTFNHHNVIDDASLCAIITMVCIQSVGCISLWEYLARYPYTIRHSFDSLKPTKGIPDKRFSAPKIKNPADIIPTVPITPDMPLYMKNVVFTGELSIDRERAMQLVVNAGGKAKTGVSRKTDYLVVGKQIYTDAEKSSKEKKAEEYNSSGEASIRIINEAEFFSIIGIK